MSKSFIQMRAHCSYRGSGEFDVLKINAGEVEDLPPHSPAYK